MIRVSVAKSRPQAVMRLSDGGPNPTCSVLPKRKSIDGVSDRAPSRFVWCAPA